MLFRNPTYGDIFSTFSPLRLFTPVGSNITEALFFIPGHQWRDSGAGQWLRRGLHRRGPAGWEREWQELQPAGQHAGGVLRCRRQEYFQQFRPGVARRWQSSFLGIVFADARIARVRITTGNAIPGPDDDEGRDIVMMDDFIYGEPQALP